MKRIDLRSDTVTEQPLAMKEAMFHAEVGDDVFGEDPTVIALESYGAQLLGKEAAMFVPSGTFGNQVAIMTHTKRGDEIIVADHSHILMYEVGGAAVLSGVQVRTVPSVDGSLNCDDLRYCIRGKDIHYPDTGLICMENAHSLGTVVPLENMAAVYALAHEHGIPVHLDGARLFNAAAALGVQGKVLAGYADSVNLCLSKGLCAPVGSLLLGTRDFIQRARKNRKLMGGGMRQAGFMAAAGLYALKEMTARLHEDHRNAQYLLSQLKTFKELVVYEDRVGMSMVFFDLTADHITDQQFTEHLLSRNIKIYGSHDKHYRFVTHYWITQEIIDQVIGAMREILK